MKTTLVNLALIVETTLVVWTGYVLYRWTIANAGPDTPFTDLYPYRGNFAVVVAPWLAALVVIPACLVVLAAAERFRQRKNSN